MRHNRFRTGKRICLFALIVVGGMLLGRLLLSNFVFPVPNSGSQASMVQVIYVTRYSKCGDTATVARDIGRNRLDSLFASLSDDWSAMEERDGKMELLKTVDDWCPNHNHYRLIKMHRGHVVVFRGQSPDDEFIVRGYRELEESLIIHRETLQQLRQGILLFDEDPDQLDVLVRSYLEGITD
ncbi:MAG TPA: hypothetical protein GX529_01495 [Firmicutes bacterium]|nr:hypothetical protein [Candidatus Fermentithermobacillaceae bacterium]